MNEWKQHKSIKYVETSSVDIVENVIIIWPLVSLGALIIKYNS